MRNRDYKCGECMQLQQYDVSSQDYLCDECLNEKEQGEVTAKDYTIAGINAWNILEMCDYPIKEGVNK